MTGMMDMTISALQAKFIADFRYRHFSQSLVLAGVLALAACGGGGGSDGATGGAPVGNGQADAGTGGGVAGGDGTNLSIAGSPVSSVSVGSVYSFMPTTYDPADSEAAISYSITGMPRWASFDSATGELSGMPEDGDEGSYTDIVITVSDGKETAALPAFDIEVRASSEAPANVNPAAAGTVKFFVDAKSNFDAWTKDPSEEQKAFMRENYYRMQTYSSYFDKRLTWYPNAWVYKDAYALKPKWTVTSENPDWILKDADGNLLYIPYACSDGACSQYAADLGNYEFRNWWMDELEATMSAGYIGVWIDDVNLKWRVGNGDGDSVKPIDPRTGVEMTYADYQRYFAEFMEAIRTRFPNAEIAHNAIWPAKPADDNDQYIRRQILAADYVNLERGVTDNLKGGSGTYGFESFLNYVDWVHSLGRNVILDDDDDDTIRERDFELAVYFLINNGNDLIGADGDRSRMNPDNFWAGYKTYLGEALGERYRQNGIFRRDFECGVVLANSPGEPSRSVSLGELMTDLNGALISSVTLGEREGEVLVKNCD
jgi:hypothetical protein